MALFLVGLPFALGLGLFLAPLQVGASWRTAASPHAASGCISRAR